MTDVSKADEAAINATPIGGLKDATDTPEPLVGSDRKTTAPVDAVERVSDESSKETSRVDSTEVGAVPSTEGHGAQAVIDGSVGLAIEADEASPKDQPNSAEAVDGSNVRPVDIERAELDAASHAEKLQDIEDEVGPDTLAVARTSAADKEGDNVRNVKKASQAADDAPPNVVRARADASLDDKDRVGPHGRHAEEVEPWQGMRWAPHGDLNVPAVSYGPEGSGALYGRDNPAARDQIRGLEGDSDAEVTKERKRTKGAVSIDKEREEENRKAKRVGRETTSTLDSR